jgi:hypothetical protein
MFLVHFYLLFFSRGASSPGLHDQAVMGHHTFSSAAGLMGIAAIKELQLQGQRYSVIHITIALQLYLVV